MSKSITNSGITVITNNHAYELHAYYTLPTKVREQFDYLADNEDEQYSDRFFNYRGYWYDANEFSVNTDTTLPYDGVQSESYWSGTAIKYIKGDYGDISSVKVARLSW